MSAASDPIDEQIEQKTYCYIHPNVESNLHCNKCGNYICPRCAVRTPVGYRCTRCIYQQQDTYFTAQPKEYVIAFVVAFALAIPINYVLARALFIAIFLGIPAGGLISEAVHRATRRQRGRYMAYIVGAAVIVGALVAAYPQIAIALDIQDPSVLIFPAIAAVLCTITAAARFRLGR